MFTRTQPIGFIGEMSIKAMTGKLSSGDAFNIGVNVAFGKAGDWANDAVKAGNLDKNANKIFQLTNKARAKFVSFVKGLWDKDKLDKKKSKDNNEQD